MAAPNSAGQDSAFRELRFDGRSVAAGFLLGLAVAIGAAAILIAILGPW